jgi:sugar phosphate isomerase/epimerase
MDQMNMVSQETFFDTTALIRKTFRLLAEYVGSVHIKDLACDHRHMFLKYDEVALGDGVMDLSSYLKAIETLGPEMTCYLEHMAEERDYAMCAARLHAMAEQEGLRFLRRGETVSRRPDTGRSSGFDGL